MLFDLLRESVPARVLSETSLLNENHVIDISEIARFYYETSPRERWSLDDFTPCASQWEQVFMEWRLPEKINSEGQLHPNMLAGAQLAVSIHQETYVKPSAPPVLDTEKIKRLLYEQVLAKAIDNSSVAALSIVLMTPDELWERADEQDREAVLDAARAADKVASEQPIDTLASAVLWTYVLPKPPELRYLYRYPLTPGGAVMTADFQGQTRHMIDVQSPAMRPVPTLEQPHALSFLHVPLLALKMFRQTEAYLEEMPTPVGTVRERMVIKPWVGPNV